MTEQPIKLEQTDARQGKTGLGVRYVLMGGLALIILAGIVIFMTVH